MNTIKSFARIILAVALGLAAAGALSLAWRDNPAGSTLLTTVGDITATGLNVDSNTLFVDATNNKVVVGHNSSAVANVAGRLQLHGSSVALTTSSITHYGANANSPVIAGYKARGGSCCSPSVITTGDDLLQFSGYGYVGGTNQFVESTRILFDSTGTISDASNGIGGIIRLYTRASGGNVTEQVDVDDSGRLLAINPTGGIGYGTGAGGTVTQATSKSTGATCSKVTCEITMNGAALTSQTTVSFTLTNTTLAATDQLVCTHHSAGTIGAYTVTAFPAAGSATVALRNITAGSLSEAVVLKCNVFKAAAS